MKKSTALFFCSLILTISFAQPGALDLSFNPGNGASFTIERCAVQNDNKFLIVGQFDTFDNVFVNHIARLNSNGSRDTTFKTGTGTDGNIYALALQPDGRIIIGGEFSNYKNDSVTRLARIFADGTLDTTFHLGSGPNATVRTIALQPDGKIIVGGDFTVFNGSICQSLARINADGSVDSSFHTSYGANGRIVSTIIRPDGEIYVGGSFTSYAGLYYFRLALIKSDGTPDISFNQPIGGASGEIMCFSFQNTNTLLIGGDYTYYNGNFINYIERINLNGIYDNNFFPGQGANNVVFAVDALSSGKILIGGTFTSYDGKLVNRLAQLSFSGALDTTFNINGSGPADQVSQIQLQADGKIIINGWFTSYNGKRIRRIARLYNCYTQQPDSIYGYDHALCNGSQQTYSIQPVQGALKYEWTLPSGWLGSSDSASIIATSNGLGGIITVKAFTDSCGWSNLRTRKIDTVQPPTVKLCLVTVDSQSTHNIIIWEKPITSLIDSFLIYRETSTNIYTEIAAVPYDSLSEYHDTTANPNTTSYRYKISTIDTCGVESTLSPYHSTIHLQNLGTGNFQWTFYEIENAVNPVNSFNVYRDSLGNGNFTQIGNVPGTNTTFTDVNYSSFPNSLYVIDANWGISCTPSRAVNTTRSNIKHINIVLSNNDLVTHQLVEAFPNPTHENLSLSYSPNVSIKRIEIINAMGQIAFTRSCIGENVRDNKEEISLVNFAPGIYTFGIVTSQGTLFKKIIIQ